MGKKDTKKSSGHHSYIKSGKDGIKEVKGASAVVLSKVKKGSKGK